ncbi:MAG: hypothetical protein K0U84_00700 [Actinomycetia bacterium]|nr:hypothetical protein [Actinomycetes bacterium]
MGERSDVVHPIDRKMHEILALIAETTRDPCLRATAIDLQLTLPPIHDWSAAQLRALRERFTLIASVERIDGI